jgi:hypothetical protein
MCLLRHSNNLIIPSKSVVHYLLTNNIENKKDNINFDINIKFITLYLIPREIIIITPTD